MDASEAQRRAALLYRVLRAIALLALMAALTSLFNKENNLLVTAGFYGSVLVWIGAATWLVRRGRVLAAAWSISVFFWVLIAAVTLLFGGLQGQNASTFAGVVLLVGSILGGSVAILVAVASSAWCALIVYLELNGLLPTPVVSYSPINAWGALVATVLLTSVLLKESQKSLRRVYEQAGKLAQERDEALRRSIQGQKMEIVGNLTSGIAHDFNNLLTIVSSASSTLRRTVAASVEPKEALDDLDEATNRAVLLIRQLVSLGRSNAADTDVINLSEVVGSLAKMLPRLLGPGIQVKTDLSEESWVHASRVALEQIILNLAVNARDAMASGGEFALTISVRDKDVQLTARDTGVGMTPDVLSRIFEPFYTTKSAGTGLGLPTVQRLVQQLGGTLTVQSNPGQGSCFTLLLLRAEAPVERSAPRMTPSSGGPISSGSQGRVVLVEDEPLVRKVTGRVLREAGYEVLAFADGEEAWGFLRHTGLIDCVLTDVSMPRMDGEELAERLAQTHPQLPIIMMSGNREPQAHFLDQPSHRYLAKPVDAELLLFTLGQLIREQRMNEEV